MVDKNNKVKIIDIGLSTQDKQEQMLNLNYGANNLMHLNSSWVILMMVQRTTYEC